MADSPLASQQQQDTDKKLADKIRKRYRSGVSFKQSQNFYEDWAEYERFWNSSQWPNPTPDTEDMPRPVTNYFASIIEQKVAALTYELPEIYFEPVEKNPDEEEGIESLDVQAAELLSMAAEHQAEKIDLEELLDGGVRSGGLLGNGIWFFPWDNTIIGGGQKSRYVGDITGYIIDPADFFPGDPTNPDMQAQPWIILAERRPLEEVKTFYNQHAPGIVELLEEERQRSDTQVYDYQKTEQDETGYVDVLHMFWKETEEVNTPMSEIVSGEPKGSAADHEEDDEGIILYETTLNYAVECQGYVLREEENFYEHALYPFVTFQWYPKRKSFWGKSESTDIIASQKESNRLSGISLLSAYIAGLPDLVYNPDWINEDDLTSSAGGRMIKDRSQAGVGNINYLRPPTPARHIPQMKEDLTAGMKETSGVHEAWSGKAPSADLNASAIIALQEAAGVRIRGIQRRLASALKEMGRIWLAHWKEFYAEPRLLRKAGPGNETGFEWFTGTDYKEMQFDVRIQAGTASPFSKTLAMTTLKELLEMQLITPEEYFELMPADVLPQAQKILQMREEEKRRQQERQEEILREEIQNMLLEGTPGQQSAPGQEPMPQQPMPQQPQQPMPEQSGGMVY